MAGVFVLVPAREPGVPQAAVDWITRETPYDDSCTTRIVHRSAGVIVGMNAHESYPWCHRSDGPVLAVLDGMIYNRAEDDLLRELLAIGQVVSRGDDPTAAVRAFVAGADGEFVACVTDTRSGRTAVFNDCMGRLSLYYAVHDGGVVFARDMRIVLRFRAPLEPDRRGVAETLMYGFPLGVRTLFEGVSTLDPGHVVCCGARGTDLRAAAAAPMDFELNDAFRTRGDAIQFLVAAYRRSLDARLAALRGRGYGIVCDLSGGFDTRVILAGLAERTREVQYTTFGYVRDESVVAESLFKLLGSPGTYTRLPAMSGHDFSRAGDLLFRTDGLVNYYTTVVCHDDVQALRGAVPYRAARFNGLGGEFIRHPYRNLALGGSPVADAWLYSAARAAQVGAALGMSPRECLGIPADDLAAYPERSRHGRLRRLYYFYYGRYVGHAGGERERGTFWCVSPLWAAEFARAVFGRVPLGWVGFPFFTEFMRALDPRLLEVPLYGSRTRLASAASVRLHHARYYLGRNNSVVKSAAAAAAARLLRRHGPGELRGDPIIGAYAEQCGTWAAQIPEAFRIIDLARTVDWPVPLRRRIASLLLYWKVLAEKVTP